MLFPTFHDTRPLIHSIFILENRNVTFNEFLRNFAHLLGQSFERGGVYRSTYVDVDGSRVSGSGCHAGYSGHLLVVGCCSRSRWRRWWRIGHCGRRGRRTAWRQQSDKDTLNISHHQALFLLRGFEAFAFENDGGEIAILFIRFFHIFPRISFVALISMRIDILARDVQIFEDITLNSLILISKRNYYRVNFYRFELIQLIYQFSKRKDFITPFSLLRFMRSWAILVTCHDQLWDVTQDRRISIASRCIIFSVFHGILSVDL